MDESGDTTGGSGDSADSGDSGDSALDTGGTANPYADTDGDGFPDVWADPEYWASGLLSPLILPTEVPSETHWEVRIATSPDGVSWTADARIIAYGFSSLDMLIAGDWVVLAGMVDGAVFADFSGMIPSYSIPALASTDLQTWGSQIWAIGAGSGNFLVDPALQLGGDGVLRATWFAHSTPGVDPAQIEGAHAVQRGIWSTTGTFVQGDPDPEYAYDSLADPVICEMGDVPWLFYTNEHKRVHAALSSDGGEHFEKVSSFSWEEPSVPFCIGGSEQITLFVQEPQGLQPPRVAVLHSDLSFEETGTIYSEHPWGDNCTSPVVGWFQGGWLLACAVKVDP